MRAPVTAVIVAIGCLAAALSACGDSATNTSQPPPTALKSHVVTDLEQARQAGITPYWLGDLIEEVGDDFRFTGNANYGDIANQLPSFDMEYWQRGERATLYVATYPPEETHDVSRLMWLSLEGAAREPVELNGWSGEIISGPEDGGEFQLIVLLRGEAAALRITALTVDDIFSEPLSDPEQLLAIIEDNLRPFPE